MALRISLGRRTFAPKLVWTAVFLLACALFIGLGQWQWQRGAHRAAQWEQFQRESASEAVAEDSRSLASMGRFERIRLTGRFDPSHQFLLDNRSHGGHAGYEVLTPFTTEDDRVILVDRGWIPFEGIRDHLPDVSFDAPAPLSLTGRIDELPVAGLAGGRAPPPPGNVWPKLTSFPDAAQLGHALGRSIEPRILLLDPEAPHGFVRDWQPPGLSPERHFGYAIQWWSFAAVAVGLWIYLSCR